jgi:hypothetical protein
MTKFGTIRAVLGGVIIAAAVTGSFTVAESADSKVTKKLKKQISVLERVIDEVLVESPNFLVGSRQNTHGVYLEEFGVLLAFEASLISKDGDWEFNLGEGWGRFGKKFKFEEKDGKIIIDLRDDDDEDDEDDDIEFDEDEWRAKHEESQKKLYEAGKAELTETLMDYGETLTTLADDQWVAVAAFLRDSDFFASNKISTLIIKAKVGDLRAYSQGNLSDRAIADRIVEEEY